MTGRRILAVAVLAALALPVAAQEPQTRQERRQEAVAQRQAAIRQSAARLARQAEAQGRVSTTGTPQQDRFYYGTPWTADFVRELCAQPAGYPRPSAATCRAAASARQWDRQ